MTENLGAKDTWDFYKDKKGEWRWRRKSSNGRIVGSSSEGYVNRADCVKNAERSGYNSVVINAGSDDAKKLDDMVRKDSDRGEIKDMNEKKIGQVDTKKRSKPEDVVKKTNDMDEAKDKESGEVETEGEHKQEEEIKKQEPDGDKNVKNGEGSVEQKSELIEGLDKNKDFLISEKDSTDGKSEGQKDTEKESADLASLENRVVKIKRKDDDQDAKKAEYKDSKKQVPFVIPSDELGEEELESVLDEDGYIVANSKQVVKMGSKINTEFNKSKVEIDREGERLIKEDDLVGKHDSPNISNSLSDLKKRFSFSWKKLGHKLAIGSLIVGVLGILGVSVAAAIAIDYYNNAPVIDERMLIPTESSIVYARDGKTELFRFYDADKNRRYASLAEISENMQFAVIGLEEHNFYNEDLPWKHILGASIKCFLSRGDNCRGASGLSQQLVKNVTGDDEATIERKIRELFTAKKLNEEKTKDEVLELYLNWVPFGWNIYGVEVAAETYFAKSSADLTLPEACFIASLPQDPINYYNGIYSRNDPESENYTHWEKLSGRKDTCLDKLYEYDIKGDGPYISTQEELDALKAEEVEFQKKNDGRKYPHWEDYIRKELKKVLTEEQLNTQGYKIVTTLDPKAQDEFEKIVTASKQNINSKGANNAAGVVLDGPTGEIIAMVGSLDYDNEKIDGQVNITTSGQAPGSSYKPYVYATAFEKGFNPSTVVVDKKTTFENGYSPNNVDNSQRGLMTLRYGLQNSLNVPAVKAAYLAAGSGNKDGVKGITEVITLSKNAGVEYPNGECPFISSALGVCDVTMVSHATGFNTFGQSGNLKTATPFISITINDSGKDSSISQEDIDRKNKEIEEKLKEVYKQKDGAVSPEIANQISNVLTDNSIRGFGTGTRDGLVIPNWVGKIAAKTGTATNNDNMPTDMWTVGFTKYYTTAIWVGNTDNKPSNAGAFGTNTATPIWNDMMEYLHKNIKPSAFSTKGLTTKKVYCPKGTLGGAKCNSEILTSEQLEKLKSSGNRISEAGYNPFEDNVFGYMGEVVERKATVSIIDEKLVKEGQVPSQLMKEVTCVDFPSAFPSVSSWYGPVKEFFDEYYKKTAIEQGWYDEGALGCPTEYSSYIIGDDETASEVVVTPALVSESNIANTVTVVATPTLPETEVVSVVLSVDGYLLESVDGDTLTFDAQNSGVNGSDKNIQILVTDSLGLVTEKNYSGIDFPFSPVEVNSTELESLVISCDTVDVDESTNCSFELPIFRAFPSSGLSIYIGDNTDGQVCTEGADRQVSCSSVPTEGNVAGENSISLQIGSDSLVINTESSITLDEVVTPDPDPDPEPTP